MFNSRESILARESVCLYVRVPATWLQNVRGRERGREIESERDKRGFDRDGEMGRQSRKEV